MTLLYASPLFLNHVTGPHHPERPERLLAVHRQLERTGLEGRCERPAWQPADSAYLAQLHDPTYVAAVERFAFQGGGHIEADTVVSPGSWVAACLAAGAVRDAVARVVAGPTSQALCLPRPPGHHAIAQGAMGFCLFNNVALAAHYATRQLGLDHVLVVDWDVHHGNGTQDLFWEDDRVGFFSIHRWPFYPGTGQAAETGSSHGLGWTRNLPVTFGTPRREYLARFTEELEDFARRVRPDLILVSAGFDSHRDDPIGSLELETEDFQTLTEVVLDITRTYAGGRLVSVLEGGYNTGALAGCVELHLRTLLDHQSDTA